MKPEFIKSNAKLIITPLLTAILTALLIFLFNFLWSSVAKNAELSATYLSIDNAEKYFTRKSDFNIFATKLNSVEKNTAGTEEKVDKLILGLAATIPEFGSFIQTISENQPIIIPGPKKPDVKKKKKTAIVDSSDPVEYEDVK
jgi:hypothetical protein